MKHTFINDILKLLLDLILRKNNIFYNSNSLLQKPREVRATNFECLVWPFIFATQSLDF